MPPLLYKMHSEAQIVVLTETQKHLAAHPEVLTFLSEAVAKLPLPDGIHNIETEIDLGRIIGKSTCVRTPMIDPKEQTTFATRKNREHASRVIVDVNGEESSKIVIIARPDYEDKLSYYLITAFIGNMAPMNLGKVTCKCY